MLVPEFADFGRRILEILGQGSKPGLLPAYPLWVAPGFPLPSAAAIAKGSAAEVMKVQ